MIEASFNANCKVSCSICSSDDLKPLLKYGTAFFPLNISICKECGFMLQNPRASEADWQRFYKDGFYDMFHRAKKDDSINSTFDELDKETFERVFHFLQTSDGFQDSVHQNPNANHKMKVCEIGAGNGEVIRSFKGMDLHAIEPSEKCREVLVQHEVKVVGKSVEDIDTSLCLHFDIILMRHVLEHVYYPLELLKQLHNLLADHGILYIAVPNIQTPNFLTMFIYPHISYFSRYSLELLSILAGFKVCEMIEAGDEVWCILKRDNEILNSDSIARLKRLNIQVSNQLCKKKRLNFRHLKSSFKRFIWDNMPHRLHEFLYNLRR